MSPVLYTDFNINFKKEHGGVCGSPKVIDLRLRKIAIQANGRFSLEVNIFKD